MKILMVNKFLYSRGGAENYMLKIGRFLEENGHTLAYFGMYDEKNTVGNPSGLYTGNMDFHGKSLSRFLYPFRIVYSLEAKRKISKVIEDFQPDIIHLNNINFQLTPSVIDAAAKYGIPIFQTVHDYQMICPNHLLYNLQEKAPCERCISGSKWNCARYKCIHDSRAKSIIGSLEGILYKIHPAYKKVDCFICPSHFLEEKLWQGADCFKGKTVAIHNFIEDDAAFASETTGGYVAFAGRLSYEKGVTLLAQTARQLPQYRFVVMGDGPDRNALENIDNVELTGFLTGDALKTRIAHADLLVVPSVWYENCPLTILEANSMGVPVITMKMGGMAELVEDGVNGLLVSEVNPEALAAAIRRAMENPEFLKEMKRNCLRSNDKSLQLEQYCSILLEKYDQAVRGRKQHL